MRPVDLLEQIHHELRTGGNTSFNVRGLAIDLTYSKGVSQAVPSHSDCHGTTRIMSKRGPTSGKDALGVSLLAGLLATVDEVIEGIVRCPSVADSVAKVPKCLATNFPLKDETSDNRRSMFPQARHRSDL